MRHERPLNGGDRSSALWGRGGRETRSSALWGRGGRSAVALLALVASVVIPAAGIAGGKQEAMVPADLFARAEANPDATFEVIVQGRRGDGNGRVLEEVKENGGQLKKAFRSINGAAATVSGKDLLKLARDSHVTAITPDDRLEVAGPTWRESVRMSSAWGLPAITCAVDLLGIQLDPNCVARAAVPEPKAPAIAIVDSGIDASKVGDFGARVVARANFSSLEPNAAGDPSGHGTMVAGVAAGSSAYAPGAARTAPLVDVRVASSQGQALTSDIVAAVDWIIANKGAYNIRVANFSLAGSKEASMLYDPLDRAVEKLWLSGIVVVTAAGNHGAGGNPVKIPAPANDPFVITVGALDMNDNANQLDDFRAPWSAFGATADGFLKPELAAPGRSIVGPVPMESVLATRMRARVVAPGYMWMSGTSFSAPMVAGVAAQILARKPGWTPDQVKGALMASAQSLQQVGVGMGELNAERAISLQNAPNPNENLHAFVSGSEFNAEAWADHVQSNSNWTVSNWTASNWVSSNWTASNWTASNWVSSNWTASNWTASNWTVSTDLE
jgi:serine protease AprX